jgi:type II secretory pathway pseudopilin PulG
MSMKKKLICLLVAGALPGLAFADSTSDQIKALQQQLNALQKEVKSLKSELAESKTTAKGSSKLAIAATPAATTAAAPEVDISSPDYGKAPARLTNDDVESMKQQIASQQLKVDSLSDAASTGPIAGLSITGYIDPSYIYNRAPGTSSFLFANHENAYNYFNSTFGDLYLDIKKTFGVGPMAPSAEITLMPNRGNGITLLANEHGDIGNNILNTAVVTVPVTATQTFVAGLMSSFGGYEVQQSNQMLTLTHNLLYDFSDPGSYVGVGWNYTPDGSQWAFKFMLGNEQYRTYGAVTQTGTNALGDPITTSNKIPTFTARADYTMSSALDIGGSFNIGRQTLSSATNSDGQVVYGPGGQATSSGGYFFFGEVDATYTLADIQYNAEVDYGQQQRAAFNGGNAQWYGLSLLAHRKFNAPVVGRMGVTARYDLLADSKNGGGGGGVALNGNGMDPYNGFGIGADCLANSQAGGGYGFECKGAVRQDVALDLLFYPTQQITVKVEYRHDWASQKVFLRNDGSYSKSNDLLGAQFIYAF